MRYLENLLADRDIKFDAKDNRIMCFPHIINICTQHVIKKFTDPDLFDDDEDPEDLDLERFLDLPSSGSPSTTKDIIASVRYFIRYVRASGIRREEFQKIIATGNASGWAPKLPQNQLLHDVKTRWDSLYFMLRRFLQMRLVNILPNS